MNKSFLLALFLFFIGQETVFASHAMGGDLTYRCLGSGPTPGSLQYELTFSFYRDCLGAVTPPNPLDIQITNSCGFVSPIVNLPLLVIHQISPICPVAISTCNGGTSNGVEEWIFQGTVVLPGYCADWTFSHSEGVRNLAITTIPNATSYNLYVYSTINNLGGLCNSSPTFSNSPVPFACAGQQFCFNHGAYDVEGDSLSYQIINPRFGPLPTDTITYGLGYSASQPVIGFSPMTFNFISGDFCIFPSQQDVTVLAILVNEYRDGVLIGQVERDIQLTVLSCVNNLPELRGFNGLPDFNNNVCINQENCFYITAVDQDSSNTTTIRWDYSIPNATFTNTGGHRDTAYFCWTPSIADTSINPYCFTVSATDDNCPYLGSQVVTYCVTVDPSPTCHSVSFVPIENKKIDWKIFPQPATENINIDFGNEFNPQKNYNIRIDNILGEIVYQSPIREKKISIDTSQWPSSGIHFVYIIDENKRIVKAEKIITIK